LKSIQVENTKAILSNLPGNKSSLRSELFNPARVVVFAFALIIMAGTVLLTLPISKTSGTYGNILDAFFTAVSASCVTGLSTVDVANFWTPFGHLVILAMSKLGGFGVMTFTSLIALLLARGLSLRARITTTSESSTLTSGDAKSLVIRVFVLSAAIETTMAWILAFRFKTEYEYSWPDAIWHGYFHAISSFNNAGFALYSDSLMSFNQDPIVILTLNLLIILGGIGFPVLFELIRRIRRNAKNRQVAGFIESSIHWSLTFKIVMWGTLILLALGTIALGFLEWDNPGTLGPMDFWSKLLNAFTLSVQPRTAGFNAIDVSKMHDSSWLITDILMFIGGGSAGTAGGLKITTIAILFFIVVTEVRGQGAVNVGNRRISRSIHRQALTIVALASAAVTAAIIALQMMTSFSTDQIIFEVISAFATVGLSTGITGQLPAAGQLILIALMFVGRIGPTAVASAMAARKVKSHIELPKERPLIG
jgi:potassium uptake TrkH family protein